MGAYGHMYGFPPSNPAPGGAVLRLMNAAVKKHYIITPRTIPRRFALFVLMTAGAFFMLFTGKMVILAAPLEEEPKP